MCDLTVYVGQEVGRSLVGSSWLEVSQGTVVKLLALSEGLTGAGGPTFQVAPRHAGKLV